MRTKKDGISSLAACCTTAGAVDCEDAASGPQASSLFRQQLSLPELARAP